MVIYYFIIFIIYIIRNPLKPNFEIPKAIIKNDEIIEIRYWNREEGICNIFYYYII